MASVPPRVGNPLVSSPNTGASKVRALGEHKTPLPQSCFPSRRHEPLLPGHSYTLIIVTAQAGDQVHRLLSHGSSCFSEAEARNSLLWP
jgi:hypothetical protein